MPTARAKLLDGTTQLSFPGNACAA